MYECDSYIEAYLSLGISMTYYCRALLSSCQHVNVDLSLCDPVYYMFPATKSHLDTSRHKCVREPARRAEQFASEFVPNVEIPDESGPPSVLMRQLLR